MKKTFKILIAIGALLLFVHSPVSAQEYGLKWTRGAAHITTKTTTNIAAQTAVLHTLIICTSNAGSSWTVTVQNKEATPKIIYAATVAAGTTVIELPVGVVMTTGIDVVTAGTTAGVMDVFYAYR